MEKEITTEIEIPCGFEFDYVSENKIFLKKKKMRKLWFRAFTKRCNDGTFEVDSYSTVKEKDKRHIEFSTNHLDDKFVAWITDWIEYETE